MVWDIGYPTQRWHSATEPFLFWTGAIFSTGPQTTMHWWYVTCSGTVWNQSGWISHHMEDLAPSNGQANINHQWHKTGDSLYNTQNWNRISTSRQAIPRKTIEIRTGLFSGQADSEWFRPFGRRLDYVYALLAYQPFPAKCHLSFRIECLRRIRIAAQRVCQCVLMTRDMCDLSVHLVFSHEEKVLAQDVGHTRSHGQPLGCRSFGCTVVRALMAGQRWVSARKPRCNAKSQSELSQ